MKLITHAYHTQRVLSSFDFINSQVAFMLDDDFADNWKYIKNIKAEKKTSFYRIQMASYQTFIDSVNKYDNYLVYMSYSNTVESMHHNMFKELLINSNVNIQIQKDSIEQFLEASMSRIAKYVRYKQLSTDLKQIYSYFKAVSDYLLSDPTVITHMLIRFIHVNPQHKANVIYIFENALQTERQKILKGYEFDEYEKILIQNAEMLLEKVK